MAAIQHVLPSGGYLNETGTTSHVVPGSSYVHETATFPIPSASFGYAKQRNFNNDQPVSFNYYIERRVKALAGSFIPQPVVLSFGPRSARDFARTPMQLQVPKQKLIANTVFIPHITPKPYTSRNRYYFQKPSSARVPKYRRTDNTAASVPPTVYNLIIDGVVREVLVATNAAPLKVSGTVREVLVHNTTPLIVDGVIREVLGAFSPALAPIPIFPTLPYGFPVKFTPNMNTVIGASTSDREVRVQQQQVPLWDIELLFEELRDQTQNVAPFAPMAGYTQYEQLVQLWLSMYGLAGAFAFDAPWDNSRQNQNIGTGDGTAYVFTITRTWGQNPQQITEPIGLINQVFDVSFDGVTVDPSLYYVQRNKIYFIHQGFIFAPPNGVTITMTFSFYYVCRFTDNNQDFEEFSEGRWTVPSLKFQSVYWP